MYGKNEKLNQVKRSCRTAINVSRVMMVVMIVAVIICLIGMASAYGLGDSINQALAAHSDNLSFDNLELGKGLFHFDVGVEKLVAAGMYNKVIMIYCMVGSVVCAVTAAVFGAICKVLKKVKASDSPFSAEVLGSVKKIFITVLVLCGIFIGFAAALVIGVVFWCIYCIMDYGCALQSEIDDTV